MPKILVCVEDVQLFLLLRHVLVNEGFDALLVTEPSEVVRHCRREAVAAAVIDWSEGSINRGALLAAVRSVAPPVAVILLLRNQAGLTVAPPSCELRLERPFNPVALLQFLRRLRNLRLAAGHPGSAGTVLRFADLEMNLSTVKVQRGGNDVALTALQFRLLRRLLQAPTVVCHRNDLIENCWPEHAEVEPRTVDIHIGHIRRALDALGPELIRTVRGRGYALQMPSGIKASKSSSS
ncbi:winged helix-turn-helix domain-containing protein [Pararhizobium sp. LjRoot235]|uniref:winged helix-turn-helix transcriptional regulator n=1 Tax=Pararhizobium sp. LjRoot235 TaxID=3342291 RepID=UPI003ECF5C5A